jgi:hypothetical protein
MKVIGNCRHVGFMAKFDAKDVSDWFASVSGNQWSLFRPTHWHSALLQHAADL